MASRSPQPAVSRRALGLQGAAGRLAADLVEPEGSQGLVIMLHGGGQTRHSWGGTAAALAGQRWTTLTYDARGHGDSDWVPSGDYSIDSYVADLRLVIDQISSPRPLVLVGASLGGMTILIAQAETPGQAGTRAQAGTPAQADGKMADGKMADGIVLVDIVPKPQLDGVERIQRFMTANPDGFASLDEAAAAIQAYNPRRGNPRRGNPRRGHPRERDQSGLGKNLRQGDDGRWRWHWDPRILGDGSDLQSLVTGTRATDAATRLSEQTGQTLLVSGGNSDVVRQEDVLRFQKLVPSAQTVNVAGAGHMVAGDRNDRFADAISRFLDGIHGQCSIHRQCNAD